MKIYNAQLAGKSEYKGRYYYHFIYQSKFIEGYGCIVVTSFTPVENVQIKNRYDIYMTDKDGYHNLRGIYEHKNKNTDRNSIDTN